MNEELALRISEKDIDIEYYASLCINNENFRKDIVDLTINHPHIMVYYHGYYILDKSTGLKPKLFYKYWHDFTKLLKHKNTYHRQIGIVILSNLSKVDNNNHFSEIFNDYLNCLYDQKILIGEYCVKGLNKIIKNKPEYKDKIIDELLKHEEKTLFNEKQEALLDYYILELIEDNCNENMKDDKIIEFIHGKQESISPKTKKKSRELIKKYGIK